MQRGVDLGMTRINCGLSRRALPGIVRRAQRRGVMGQLALILTVI
jgi:hypothetical protein